MKTGIAVSVGTDDQKALQIAEALPDFKNVALPECYTRARQALMQCERLEDIEKFHTYAQKAAFHAKLLKNGALMELAKKIEARTWRHMGEALKKLPGGQTHRKKIGIGRAPPREATRRGAAEAAGITSGGMTKAMKIASIEPEDFENVVEQPGSVSGLALMKIATAQAGGPRVTMLNNSTLKRVATSTFNTLRDFVNKHDPESVAVLFGSDRDAILKAAIGYRDWFGRFVKEAQKDDAEEKPQKKSGTR